jgi:D-galactarolactone cycloisomerase
VVRAARRDAPVAGGLSECKKIADMANALGLRCNPHVWGTGVALAASLQLLAVLPHNPPGLHPLEPWLELDQSEHPIRMAVLREPIIREGGWVAVPQAPGLGIEIDRGALDRYGSPEPPRRTQALAHDALILQKSRLPVEPGR